MYGDDPLAFFITWTVYGTFLQGDDRRWRKRKAGSQAPQPLLRAWHEKRLQHPVLLLQHDERKATAEAIESHCLHRGWRLWAVNPRTTHAHVVVGFAGVGGPTMRDQLKANATGRIRRVSDRFAARPAWSVGGICERIYEENDLETVIEYVQEAQDRKWRDYTDVDNNVESRNEGAANRG